MFTLCVISSQEKFPWVRNLTAEISLFTTKNKNDVLLKFIDASLLESNWSIVGLNVVITNAYLGHSKVNVSVGPKQETQKYVNISNSTIGQLSISGGYQIIISNCFINGKTRLSETLIHVTNSILTIKDSIFYNFKSYYNSPAILNAISSIVDIQDISCSYNSGSQGLIQISNGSKLYLANSEFENNGNIFSLSCVSIRFHSSATVFNTSFVSNSAVDGAALNCYFNSSVEVRKCNFDSNSATNGGSIICKDLIENELKNAGKFSGSSCVIIDCFFDFGLAINAGHLYLKTASAIVVNTVFGCSWMVYHGGAIAAVDHTNISILNCTFGISYYIFTGPMALIGAIIYIQNEVIIDIRGSTLKTNVICFNGFLIFATDKCKITISESHIGDYNEIPAFTFALYLQNFTEISVVDSLFDTKLGYGLAVLSATNNVKVNFTNCVFNKVTGFLASLKSEIHMTNCIISECINTLPAMSLFKLLDRCSIFIQDTNVTHNKFLSGHGFLLAEVQEKVVLCNADNYVCSLGNYWGIPFCL